MGGSGCATTNAPIGMFILRRVMRDVVRLKRNDNNLLGVKTEPVDQGETKAVRLEDQTNGKVGSYASVLKGQNLRSKDQDPGSKELKKDMVEDVVLFIGSSCLRKET
ncbi:hypothetical protein L1987_13374 [Smallanthus sonchifolius]|uniref:Uncharacterized protein n=1 Tax=Smallanthus sonchifolius TaxID=185202 RepID=A0ACB9JGA0_9ASTR|nr:hypothetical protein L1987_13374 [Smallanthus sonchifolius]